MKRTKILLDTAIPVVIVLITVGILIYIYRVEIHVWIMIRNYRNRNSGSAVEKTISLIDETGAGPLQYAYRHYDSGKGFIGMSKKQIVEMFGEPCISNEVLKEYKQRVELEFDEIIHYGDSEYISKGYHWVGDETENIFFLMKNDRVVYVDKLFP